MLPELSGARSVAPQGQPFGAMSYLGLGYFETFVRPFCGHISDAATEDLPINFNLTLSAQNEVSVPKVLMQLAKNPLALPSLIRFGRQSKRAGALLASFLESYLQELAGRGDAKPVSEVAAR